MAEGTLRRVVVAVALMGNRLVVVLVGSPVVVDKEIHTLFVSIEIKIVETEIVT